MMSSARCPRASLVERHFSARIRPTDEQTLRAHLPRCQPCRRLYERKLVLARLDPAAPGAQARLARGLGLGSSSRKRWGALVGVASAAMVVLLCVTALRAPKDDGFVARGGAVAAGDAAELRVYRLRADGQSEAVAGTIQRGDELAFAYTNPGGRRHLMVYAVDELGTIYWYVPAWTDPASAPRAPAIQSGAKLHELGDAVTHELRGQRLTLHALFTDESFGVREIEALLARSPDAATLLGRPHLELALAVRP